MQEVGLEELSGDYDYTVNTELLQLVFVLLLSCF